MNNNQITTLPAPPDQSFEAVHLPNALAEEVKAAENTSRKAAEDYVLSFAREHGYGVSIGHSHRYKPARPNSVKACVDIKCERGDSYRCRSYAPGRQPIRANTGTKLTGCPFRVKLTLRGTTWSVHTLNSQHNHAPAPSALSSSSHRHRDVLSVRDDLESAWKTGISAADALEQAQKKHNRRLAIKVKDVYNVYYRQRVLELQGLQPIQALLLHDIPDQFYLFDQIDERNSLKSLAFFHKKAVEQLFKRYPSLVIIDSTYKTNKFNFPMLSIIGQSPLGNNFFIGGAFLQKEDIESFTWVMNHFRQLYHPLNIDHPQTIITDADPALIAARSIAFPDTAHILCRWHINKDIEAKFMELARDSLINDRGMARGEASTRARNAWHQEIRSKVHELLNSRSADQFYDLWNTFQHDYRTYPDIIQYIARQWMPHKEKIVSAWVDQNLHFGNSATSAIESWHASLKGFLGKGRTRLHLRDVLIKLNEKVNSQIDAVRAALDDVSRKHQNRQAAIFSLCLEKISEKALDKVRRHMNHFGLTGENADSVTLAPCTGVFRRSLGCPCAHEVYRRLRQGEVLAPEDFHMHWHVIDTIEPVDYRFLVRDPERIVRRRVPENNMASTGRILSRFEQVNTQLTSDIEPGYSPHAGLQENVDARQSQQAETRKRKRGLTCGACGASGHKRTNRGCPQYRHRQTSIRQPHDNQETVPTDSQAEETPVEDRIANLERQYIRAASPLSMRGIAADLASLEEDREWNKFESEKVDIEKQFEFPLERLQVDLDDCQLFIRESMERGEVSDWELSRRDEARDRLNATIREKDHLLAEAKEKWQRALLHNERQQDARQARWRAQFDTNSDS